jgi:hypothetical protein
LFHNSHTHTHTHTHSLAKEIIAELPRDRDDLFALPLDPAVLSKHDIPEAKIRPWLVKNMGAVGDEAVLSYM